MMVAHYVLSYPIENAKMVVELWDGGAVLDPCRVWGTAFPMCPPLSPAQFENPAGTAGFYLIIAAPCAWAAVQASTLAAAEMSSYDALKPIVKEYTGLADGMVTCIALPRAVLTAATCNCQRSRTELGGGIHAMCDRCAVWDV